MVEEQSSKRSYLKSNFSNGLQPLSLKSIPEDDYPSSNAVSFSSILNLVSQSESTEKVPTAPTFIPIALAKYTGILLTLIASLFFSIGVRLGCTSPRRASLINRRSFY